MWESESEGHSVLSDSLWPHELYSPGNSPCQNTGVGSSQPRDRTQVSRIAGRFFTSFQQWVQIDQRVCLAVLSGSKSAGKRMSASFEFSSVTQSCPTLCDPMNHSTPGLPVHQQLPEFTETHVHRVDAIQPYHPLSSPSPPAYNPSQHQSLFQWVNPSHEVAKVLELQL